MAVLASAVDTGALLKVVGASLVAGVGVTAIFSVAIAGVVRAADLRRDDRPVEAAALVAVALVALVASVAAVVIGIVAMTDKD